MGKKIEHNPPNPNHHHSLVPGQHIHPGYAYSPVQAVTSQGRIEPPKAARGHVTCIDGEVVTVQSFSNPLIMAVNTMRPGGTATLLVHNICMHGSLSSWTL